MGGDDILVNGWKTFIARCNVCREIMEDDFNLFQGNSIETKDFTCECGNIVAVFENSSPKNPIIKVNCYLCGGVHSFDFDIINLLLNNKLYKCIYGVEICFIGDFKNLDYFTDDDIMISCLRVIDTLQTNNKIHCKCGFLDIGCRIYYDRIEIICKSCNGIIIVYAENQEDLQALKDKEVILLNKEDMSCLGSCEDKRRDLTNLWPY